MRDKSYVLQIYSTSVTSAGIAKTLYVVQICSTYEHPPPRDKCVTMRDKFLE